MTQIVFVHGMFQNPKSWDHWVRLLTDKGYECLAPAWPLHDGEPAALRQNPPSSLGELSLDEVYAKIVGVVANLDRPIVVGHSVGGLIAQKLLAADLVSGAVAISSVAPNAMLDFDWGFIKNSAIIANPLKGDEPVFMDAETFHDTFANTLTEEQAAAAFVETATHDSRNVLRDCMGASGKIDLSRPHAPLLLIAGEKDEIIPAHLSEKNFRGYDDEGSVTAFKEFANRSHYICNEPGWEEVATFIAGWLEQSFPASLRGAGTSVTEVPSTIIV
jgi:pimeloyl-ACP methyl ester carboxylesterase